MRCYTFNHFMFNGLCKGIQSNHATHAIRHTAGAHGAMYHEWDHDHKTLVYLQGGNSASLHNVVDTFRQLAVSAGADSEHGFSMPMPWATFHEDEATLEGILTAIAIVIPARYYIGAALMRKNRDFATLTSSERAIQCMAIAMYEPPAVKAEQEMFTDYTQKEIEFMSFMNNFPLAPTA